MLLTDYSAILENLFQRRPKGKAKDLKAFSFLLQHYGNPQNSYPCIHVAGTNGKGQTTAKIAHALQDAGYKVGLFISPHLFEYTERISINGQKIPKETVVEYHLHLDGLIEDLSFTPHFFDCTTLYAFRYFQEQNVDVAAFETGLGGKFDATNVVTPLVSVITSISHDHVDTLGQTLEEIAWQKAGIIKPGVPVVIGPNAKFQSIFQKAKELSSPLYAVEKTSSFYDKENQEMATAALALLKKDFSLTEENIEAGLKFSLPCRFERKGNVLYDVAHNPDGFQRLSEALVHFYPGRTFRFVIGMSSGKDIKRSLEKINKQAHYVHFVQAEKEKTISAHELAKVFTQISSCPFSVEASVFEGYQKAKAAAEDLFVVCGSFYIMQEVIPIVTNNVLFEHVKAAGYRLSQVT